MSDTDIDKLPLPTRCCGACGKRYGKQPSKAICITMSKDTCEVCGESDVWTAPEYDWGWLREGWRAEQARCSSNSLDGGET